MPSTTARTAKLQSELAARGLATTGASRHELVQRLANSLASDPEEDPMSARWDWVQQILRQSYPPPHPVLGTYRQYRRPGEVISARMALAQARDAARGGAKAKLNAKAQAVANREARGRAQLSGASTQGMRRSGPKVVGPTASGRRTAPRFMAPTRSIQQKYGPADRLLLPGHSHAPLRQGEGAGAGTGTGTSPSNTLLTHPLQTVVEADHLQNWSHAAPRRFRPLPQPPPRTAPDPRCAAGPFTEHNVGFSPSWRRAKPSGNWMDEQYNFRLGSGDPLADPPHMGIMGRYADAGPRVGKYLDRRGASGPEDMVWVDAASAYDGAGPLSGWNPNGIGGRCKWNHGVGDPLLPPGWQGPAGSSWPRHEMAARGALVSVPVAQLHPLANGAPPGFAVVPVFIPNAKQGDTLRGRDPHTAHKTNRPRAPRQQTAECVKKNDSARGTSTRGADDHEHERTNVAASTSSKLKARQAADATDNCAVKHVRRKDTAKHIRRRDEPVEQQNQRNRRNDAAKHASRRDEHAEQQKQNNNSQGQAIEEPTRGQRHRQRRNRKKEQNPRALKANDAPPVPLERPPTPSSKPTIPLSARIATSVARGRSWRLRPE